VVWGGGRGGGVGFVAGGAVGIIRLLDNRTVTPDGWLM